MTFLRNVWYVAAWSDELAIETPISRKIIEEPLLIWRQADGTLSALVDRCSHRFAPLSNGSCEGRTIRCLYHGLRFDEYGLCVENPHGPVVKSLNVRAFPMVERHKIAWVWMGDPEKADPSSIPDLSFIERSPQHAISKGYMLADAGHQLFVDNILDLSHADYLHPATLGGGSITRSKAKIEERENSLFVSWLAFNEMALPIMRSELSDPDMLTDMWTEVLWYPSGVMALDVGVVPAGQPRDTGLLTENVHIMTPETSMTTHYFYSNARNYKTDDAEYNLLFSAALRLAFETEDKPMIEGQQRNIGSADLFDLKPALLTIDNASARARRVYDRLLSLETGREGIDEGRCMA